MKVLKLMITLAMFVPSMIGCVSTGKIDSCSDMISDFYKNREGQSIQLVNGNKDIQVHSAVNVKSDRMDFLCVFVTSIDKNRVGCAAIGDIEGICKADENTILYYSRASVPISEIKKLLKTMIRPIPRPVQPQKDEVN